MQPFLVADVDGAAGHRVEVRDLDAETTAALVDHTHRGGTLRDVLWVAVTGDGTDTNHMPSIAGSVVMAGDAIRFEPHFLFEPGETYRARFDPRPIGRCGLADALTLTFAPPPRPAMPVPVVTQVFPSPGRLPENLLRFSVCFSNPMRRGHAATEIALLGSDGMPVADALYRAPVELWDSELRCLTVLLDPGRLKRGVGPNRELGPPLRVGEAYALAIGAGMTDAAGLRLAAPVRKLFRATAAVRQPIRLEHWQAVPPAKGSRQPLVLISPRPLDRTLLERAITIASPLGSPVSGLIAIARGEQRLGFTPDAPWAAGRHRVSVAAWLEDVCGNTIESAFDRPLQAEAVTASPATGRTMDFHLA